MGARGRSGWYIDYIDFFYKKQLTPKNKVEHFIAAIEGNGSQKGVPFRDPIPDE